MAKKRAERLLDRELSWLAFNGRVLQEAEDPDVPAGERLAFLAIFSSNLDEFFRVRVASLRSLLRLGRRSQEKLAVEPETLLREIHERVDAQQTRFGRILRESVMPALAAHGITLVDESGIDAAQAAYLRADFEARVRPELRIVACDDGADPPFLENRRIYLVVELGQRGGVDVAGGEPRRVLIGLPDLPRFVTLPGPPGRHTVMFLDDLIRFNLDALFPHDEPRGAWAVKLTRDAELYLEDEYAGGLVDAIRKGVARRATGVPSRFLYDPAAPWAVIAHLKQRLGLEDEDLVPGGRYHNLSDLAAFPRFGMDDLSWEPLPPLPHPTLHDERSLLDAVLRADRLLHFPYQSFDYVIRLLEQAAADPEVTEIRITLYRVARDSAVVRALVAAARAGKRVTAFVEAKARFDEETNLEAGRALESAGARTLYSLPGLKVHAKLALITRGRGATRHRLAYLGTGNFNERTARVYADHALLTADPRLTEEVARVFAFLEGEDPEPHFEQLLVAPFDMRQRFYGLIAREATAAAAGRPAGMLVKVNSLEDDRIIERLYDAGRAGVPIELIVRGICCLAPGEPDRSEAITARSIVDRFLEHARAFLFHAGGEDRLYLASADWMKRNLSRRVEVAFPIHDLTLKRELLSILELQRRDDRKARILDADFSNRRVPRGGGPAVRAQLATYRMLEDMTARTPHLRRKELANG